MNNQYNTDTFAVDVMGINNESISDTEKGYKLCSLCASNSEYDRIAIVWSYPCHFAQMMYDDGDNGILEQTIKDYLGAKQAIIALAGLREDWDLFEQYISDIRRDNLFVEYLLQLYPDDRKSFWTELFEMYGEDYILFESIIYTINYEQQTI